MDICGNGTDAVWFSNTSSAVIQIDPSRRFIYTITPPSDPMRREAFDALAVPVYDPGTTDIFLQPGASVHIRSQDGRFLSVVFSLPLIASSQSYVALLLVDWLESKITPRGFQLAESFKSCVEKLASAMRSDPKVWDAQLVTSIDLTVQCGSLAKDVLDERDLSVTRRVASTQLTDDIARTIDDIPVRAPTLELPYNRLSRLLGKLLQLR